MHQDNLKSMWKGISSTRKENEALRSMLQEKNQPEFKRMGRQLLIEIFAFAIFLLVYYDFFDGDRKPLHANILLVFSILLTIIHNLAGYALSRKGIKNDTITQSLEGYLSNIKTHAAASVVIRTVAAACLLLFFTSTIEFNTTKYWILGGVILIFVVQIALLANVWNTRIRRMKETLDSFSAGQ